MTKNIRAINEVLNLFCNYAYTTVCIDTHVQCTVYLDRFESIELMPIPISLRVGLFLKFKLCM